MEDIRFHGAPMLRVKREDLLARGVERVLDRVTGVRDGLPVLGDDRVLDVANVVWATGFKQVFDWIRLPVIGADGWPSEMRGVVTDAPGPVLLRAVLPVRLQFDGAAGCRPGRGVRRQAHRGPIQCRPDPCRCLTERAFSRVGEVAR